MMGGELKIKELLMLLMLMLMIERNFFFVEDCCNFSCLYKHIARKGSRLKKILGRLFPQLLWPHAAAAAAGGGALRPRPRLWCCACAANKEQSFFVKENRRAFGRVFS